MENIFQKGQKITLRTMFVVIFFALVKGITGVLSGSIVLIADAVHSAADSFSTFLVWLGLKIAQKKPTEKFQYGYYKVENLTTLLVSFLIFYAGFEIVRESIAKLFTSYQLRIPFVAIGAALLDAIVMFFVGTYEVKVGKKIHAQSLVADGSESRMHLFSSSIVILGLLSAYFKIAYIEGMVGIIVSIFIFAVGLESARDSILVLMDVSPAPNIEKKIITILNSQHDLQDFGELKLRKSGPFVFGEVKAKMGKGVSVERAHEITEEIERNLKNRIPQIDSFLIHIEPLEKPEKKIIFPAEEKNGANSKISDIFSKAKYFAVLTVGKKGIKHLKFKENPFQKKEIRAGLSVAKHLLEENPDVLITKEIGPIAFHTLRDNLIEIYKTKQNNISDAIEKFLSGDISRLGEPTRTKR